MTSSEPLLPAGEVLDLPIPHCVRIAPDLWVGATQDRVYLKWDRPTSIVTFGPLSWDRLLRTIAEERTAQRPLAAGDEVRHSGWIQPLTLLSIDGEWAWCRDAEGQHPVVLLGALTRA